MLSHFKSVVFNEDCNVVMKRYPDNYFDLAVCDIPYGIGVTNMAYLKENKTTIKQKNGTRLNGSGTKQQFEVKEWDSITPSQSYFNELRRISKHQIIFGVEYVNWDGLGTGRIKWNKGVPKELGFKGYELAYCSKIDFEIELPLLWSGMRQAKSLSEPMTQRGNKRLNEKRIQPCHKPILLYDKLFIDYGFEGMKVIDTHLGSGSIRISADRFGVSEFVGCETDKEQFDKQELRFKNHKMQLSIFDSFV